MSDVRLASRIHAILSDTGLAPENLVVEVPETAHQVDIRLIEALRELGVRVAIDDVGCQYSNLERLVDIPAEIAKIDRRWVPSEDATDANERTLLSGLVMQCRWLGLDVVVEGIESLAQYDFVRTLDVAGIQGFYFGKPVDPVTFEQTWASAKALDRPLR